MGSSGADTNTTSPWSWISPELPLSVEESLGIHTASEIRHSPLTTQPVFMQFCNLLHNHPCFCRHKKRKNCDSSLSQRRDLMQQEFKGTIQCPDTSAHIKCLKSLHKTHAGIEDASNLQAASFFAEAITGEFGCTKQDSYNYIKRTKQHPSCCAVPLSWEGT